MKLSEIRALAVESLAAMLRKPTLWKATCTPGLRDDREERMAEYIRSLTTNAELLADEDGPSVHRDTIAGLPSVTMKDYRGGFLASMSPEGARALAVELLHAADGEDADG